MPATGSLNWALAQVRAAFWAQLARMPHAPEHVPAELWQEQQAAIAVRDAHVRYAAVLAKQPDFAFEPHGIGNDVAAWLQTAIQVREFVAATLAVDGLRH